jgi:predicted dehydrogenase
MSEPLRVGVIGLGPLWRRRYRPALRALPDRFQVVAVCDPLAGRAGRAAKRLGCAAAAGPTELLERPDIDALLLVDAPWYGLWPVQLACRLGKPALCCPPRALDGEAETVRQAEQAAVPVMVALTLRDSPAARRLRELLGTTLGPPRLVLCAADDSGPGLLDLLDWSGSLFGGPAERATRAAAGPLQCLLLDHGGGRAVQITHRGPCPHDVPLRLEVIAERGRAVLRPPDRLTWRDAAGRQAQRLGRGEAPEQALLRRFHEAVTQGRSVSPTLAEVWRLRPHLLNEPEA